MTSHRAVDARPKGAELKVASPSTFVGRRRLQSVHRALSAGVHAGVLLRGLGRLGKTSMAARLANLLVDLLSGPCASAGHGQPVLLLIDDLEQVLQVAAGDASRFTLAAEGVRQAMEAVLRALDPETSVSRLIVTSRFPFQLVDGDQDLAARLFEEELGELGPVARQKLTQRQLCANGSLEGTAAAERGDLLLKVEEIARGNPGLQDLLGLDLVLRADVSIDDARSALGETAAFLAGSVGSDREREIERLHAKIGQLVVERDFLARGSGR